MIENEEGIISIIEIEKKAKSPKYILGDLYAVLYSDHYSDGKGNLIGLDELKGIYVVIARNINEKSSKRLQYEKLMESYEEMDEVGIDFEIFWKEEIGELILNIKS